MSDWAGSISEWASTAKGVLDVMKSAASMLPQGENRDEVDRKIQQAQEMLARADAKLAKDLGGHLCQCDWPFKIMRWQAARSAYVCPACGDFFKVWRGDDSGSAVDNDYDPLGRT